MELVRQLPLVAVLALVPAIFCWRTTTTLPQSNAARKCWEDPRFEAQSGKSRNREVIVYSYPQLKSAAREILSFGVEIDGELEKFFGRNSERYRIYVTVDRDGFSALFPETIDWKKAQGLIGAALTPQDQILLNPAEWDVDSRRRVNLRKLVKHEMSHSYSLRMIRDYKRQPCMIPAKKRLGDDYWYWFEEGLATYVAGQVEDWRREIENDLKTYPNLEYATSASVVGFLLQKFGKERIFAAIRRMPTDYAQATCAQKCDQILFSTLGILDLRSIEADWKIYKNTK